MNGLSIKKVSKCNSKNLQCIFIIFSLHRFGGYLVSEKKAIAGDILAVRTHAVLPSTGPLNVGFSFL